MIEFEANGPWAELDFEVSTSWDTIFHRTGTYTSIRTEITLSPGQYLMHTYYRGQCSTS